MAGTTHENRLRQIAVLVASVDATAARQLLLNLPTEIARQVRALAADLGPVSPEERRTLLAEFHKSQSAYQQPGASAQIQTSAQTTSFAAVLDRGPTKEVPNQFMGDATVSGTSQVDLQRHSNSSPAWTGLRAEALLRFVRLERPNVVAVILQQLPAQRAAELLQQMPPSLARNTLRCLGNQREIDPEAKQALDQHLSHRLEEYRRTVESQQENTKRMNALLAAAPTELKQQWAHWMRPDDFQAEELATSESTPSAPASKLTESPVRHENTDVSALEQYYRNESAVGDSFWEIPSHRRAAGRSMAGSTSSMSRSAQPESTSAQRPSSHQQLTSTPQAQSRAAEQSVPAILPFGPRSAERNHSDDHSNSDNDSTRVEAFEQILTLEAQRLAVLLSSLDSQTILLSLAGASTQFMKRFCELLEPADARILQDRLKRIGPVNLREIDQAQMRVIAALRMIQQRGGVRRAA